MFSGCSLKSSTDNRNVVAQLEFKKYVTHYSNVAKSSKNGLDIDITVLFPKPVINRDGIVTMKGVVGEKGKYRLPSQDIYVAIPCGYNLKKVKTTKVTYGGSFTKATLKANRNIKIFDSNIFSHDDIDYKVMSLGNSNYVKITVSPCNYSSIVKKIKFNSYYKINVTFKEKTSQVGKTFSMISNSQAKELKEMVINPESVNTYIITK
jgi:hypothetical protein